MGKLLDNLRKKHAASQPTRGRHTVNFLAHKDEITEAMREGWTAKQIWEQMQEDGMTTMSYSTFCRHVEKHIMPARENMKNTPLSPNASPSVSPSSTKSQINTSTKKAQAPERSLTEKERLDLLKEEAFASVRSTKPTGPLISKPKSRDEEKRDLFG